MIDFDILDNDFLDNGISDELLAAYIDGNTTKSENALIENVLNGDSMLLELCEIANDSVSFGSNFDWGLQKDDYEFWKLELSPAVIQTEIDQETHLWMKENESLPPIDDTITSSGLTVNDINNDITTNDLNINDY